MSADAPPPRPAPESSGYGEPFWAAAREHRLVLQHGAMVSGTSAHEIVRQLLAAVPQVGAALPEVTR